MMPTLGPDPRTECTVQDRVARSIRGLEGNNRAAEPERRVMARAQSNRMLVRVRAIVPLSPERNRPAG